MDYQGKTEKQVTDSMKIIFWSSMALAGTIAAHIICNFIF